MNTHITLNPEYEYLRAFITNIPQTFSSSGNILYQGRNEIRTFEKENIILNIKEFRVPILPNRFIYHSFRQTKAQRAYEYAFKLKEAGFNTPTPIAFIITQNKGMLGRCYFISKQVHYTRRFYEFGTSPIENKENIIRDFGVFTAKLHNAGIYHKDYSPGNILFDVKDGETEFCLVDINRMEFGCISLKKGCKNFARLWGKEPFFRILAEIYADGRNFDKEKCIQQVLKYRRKFWIHHLKKRQAKFEIDL